MLEIYINNHTLTVQKRKRKKRLKEETIWKKKKDLVYPRIKKYKIFLFKEFIELTKRR